MNLQHPTTALQRIGLLLKREWTLQHRALLKGTLVLLLVLWGLRLTPLLFGKDYSEWAEGLRHDPLFLSNTLTSLLGFFIFYLIWVNKTVHKSQTETYTLIPASVGEKYTTFFIVALCHIVLALFIGVFSSTALALLVPGCLEYQLSDWGRFVVNINVDGVSQLLSGIIFFFSYTLLSFLTYMVCQIFFSKATTGALVAICFLTLLPSASPVILISTETLTTQVTTFLFIILNLLLSVFFLFFGYYTLKRKQLK
ncbi:hypothetical protein [Porphyromonas circumdentaria]|uniref:Uncharacterized protein n=1 Tax=Porphyromonas circumdentaria TaxID=29524 RepID=A0A1T4PZQ7_9PORP|nr:hypothetical protein [Porphyromonas circumdentaria]MBB6276587.1 hypothetical protein [Porphyromonas circumdentaria]SJZ96994.1 hypothetical protein SAMN02745171_01653 [Porphyromonas circumdentaria]